MKKYNYGIFGGLLFGAICIVITWLIGALFGPLYQGEEESSRNFKLFLFAFSVSVIIGVIVGLLHGKKVSKK